MLEGKNPCDICKSNGHCDDCVMNLFAREFECRTEECFLNYEGTCILGFYENCKASGKPELD